MIGVRGDGTKELIALADGFRESAQSWADLVREGKRRGMAAPVLAIGDGASGFCKAIREVFPRHPRAALLVPRWGQRACRTAEVGAPRREGGAGRDRQRRGQGPRTQGGQGIRGPLRRQVAKAVAKVTEHLDVLLAFYNYPAEHWVPLRTTNPIESTFATVRLRQRVTKDPGSRAAGVAMAFKLIESAQRRWRAVNAPHLVAPVRTGAKFDNGKLIERRDESGGDQQVA